MPQEGHHRHDADTQNRGQQLVGGHPVVLYSKPFAGTRHGLPLGRDAQACRLHESSCMCGMCGIKCFFSASPQPLVWQEINCATATPLSLTHLVGAHVHHLKLSCVQKLAVHLLVNLQGAYTAAYAV